MLSTERPQSDGKPVRPRSRAALALDPTRDLDFRRINQLHRARGNVKKQGAAFSESREQFEALTSASPPLCFD
jgi:hypothetical protein